MAEITPVFCLNVKNRYYTKVYLKGYETVRFSNCERPFFILEKKLRKNFQNVVFQPKYFCINVLKKVH